MNKKQKVLFNKNIATKIESLNRVIGDIQDLINKHKDENKNYQLNESLETLVSSRDELYDCLYTYETQNGNLEYFGLENCIL